MHKCSCNYKSHYSSTLLVVCIDKNAGGCKAPADGMSGCSTDTGSLVWWSHAVIDGWLNLPEFELENSSQDGCSVEHSQRQQDAVVVASAQLCMTFLCLLLACWEALLCVWWWFSKSHILVLVPSNSWTGCIALDCSPLGHSTNASDPRQYTCP